MAHHSSAKRRIRQTERRTEVNGARIGFFQTHGQCDLSAAPFWKVHEYLRKRDAEKSRRERANKEAGG